MGHAPTGVRWPPVGGTIDPVTARSRRRLAILAATLIAVGAWPGGTPTARATSLEPRRQPDSRIERPMADVHILAPSFGSSAPRLLVIDAGRPTPGAVRMALLEREGSWSERAVLEVALRPADGGAVRPEWALDAPWMLPTDAAAVAVIANASVEDAAYVTHVEVASGAGDSGVRLAQGAGLRIPFRVDDAGIADIDGDGRPSLLVASARTERAGGTCQGTTILVLDPVTLARQATLELAAVRIAGAVIGRFDDVPGDDLFAYGYPNCPATPDTAVEARALAINLLDGSVAFDEPAAVVTGFLGSPMRVDAADGRHAVVARLAAGLTLIEPGDPWRKRPLAAATALPLAAAAVNTGAPGDVLVAWLDPVQVDVAIWTATVTEGEVRTTAFFRESVDFREGADPRWQQLVDGHDEAVRTGTPPVAFLGDVDGLGCPSLFMPGSIVTCDEEMPRGGAAWTATRPVHIFDADGARRMLVAAGVGWEVGRFPGAPAPAAADVAGWWRHGPSVPFVLAEARAADATCFRSFPIPTATVERVSGPEGTVDLPGFTGTRLLVRITVVAPDATEPATVSRDDLLGVLPAADERVVVARVEVPPAVDTGRDGAFTRVDLGPARTSGGPWLVSVVPINDWGELGRPAVGIVARDGRAPLLEMAVPFTTPLWPNEAELTGVAEPGASVFVDGVGPLELDRRGRFVMREVLGPWPRTFHLSATDASGNVAELEVTVVGGIDYRQLPLELLLAGVLIVAAVASGIFGSRQRRLATDGDGMGPDLRRALDDGPGPEIEDLPSGSGGLTRH